MGIFINIILTFSILLIVSVSFSLFYYPTKIFNIAHAAVVTLGAYLVYLFAKEFSLPFFFSLFLAIFFSIIIGLLIEVIFFRYLRKRNAPTLAYFITSIGLYVVLQNIISLYFGDETKIINSAEVSIGHQVFGSYITTVQLVTIAISIVLFVTVNFFLKFTVIGKSIRAISSNQELCNIYGISSNKIILIAFGIGSALAATAGILSAMDTNMTPTFGFNLLLFGLVAMIIGGVGSTRGLIVGALLVATSQHLAAYYIDTKWMDAITYVILILFLIWKPLGFSGKRLKKVEV